MRSTLRGVQCVRVKSRAVKASGTGVETKDEEEIAHNIRRGWGGRNRAGGTQFPREYIPKYTPGRAVQTHIAFGRNRAFCDFCPHPPPTRGVERRRERAQSGSSPLKSISTVNS